MNQLTVPGASPFDAIRRTREDGTEYWSGRDLQPLMAYSRWGNFEVPLQRAMKAAENQGIDMASNFLGSRNPVASGTGGNHTQADFELSRFAAYLVAMNGDPNKPEVAAAQAYFAIRTREAEIAPVRQLSGPELMAAALIEAQATIEAATARTAELEQSVKVLEPKADAFDAFLATTGDYSIRDAAHVLSRDYHILTGEKRLRQTLIDWGWCYRDRDGKPRASQRHADLDRVAEKSQWHYHPETGEKVLDTPQVRIKAKGLDQIRQRLLEGVVA